MVDESTNTSPAREPITTPRRHRFARACVGAVGGVLILLGVSALIPALTSGGVLLGVFESDTVLGVFRLCAGAAIVASTFVPSFVWGRSISIALGLFFGALGLAGGLVASPVFGVFHVNTVDNSLHVLLCTALVGASALSLDLFDQIAG